MKNTITLFLIFLSQISFAQNTSELLIKDEQIWKDAYNTLKTIYITQSGKLIIPKGSKCAVYFRNEGAVIANGTKSNPIIFDNVAIGGKIELNYVNAKSIHFNSASPTIKNSTIEITENKFINGSYQQLGDFWCENSVIMMSVPPISNVGDIIVYGNLYLDHTIVNSSSSKTQLLNSSRNITVLNSKVSNAHVCSNGAVNIANSDFTNCVFKPRNTDKWYKESIGWKPQTIQNNNFNQSVISVIVHEKCTYQYNTFGKDNDLVFSISSNDEGEPKIDHRMAFKHNNFLDIATTTITTNSPKQGERYCFSIGAEIPINLPNNYFNDKTLLQNITTDYTDDFKIPGKFNFEPTENTPLDISQVKKKIEAEINEIQSNYYNREEFTKNPKKTLDQPFFGQLFHITKRVFIILFLVFIIIWGIKFIKMILK